MTTTVGGAEAPPPQLRPTKLPSLMTASLRVFDVSLGEMLWSRRTVFLGLIVGGPVLIAIILLIYWLRPH